MLLVVCLNEECSSECGGSVYDAARPGDGHWTTTKHNEFLSSHQAGQPGRPLASTEVRRGRGGGWELRWGEGVFIGFQFSSQQPPAQAAARQWRQQQTPHIRNQSQPLYQCGVYQPSPAGTACPATRPCTSHTLGRSVGRRHAGGQHLTCRPNIVAHTGTCDLTSQ